MREGIEFLKGDTVYGITAENLYSGCIARNFKLIVVPSYFTFKTGGAIKEGVSVSRLKEVCEKLGFKLTCYKRVPF